MSDDLDRRLQQRTRALVTAQSELRPPLASIERRAKQRHVHAIMRRATVALVCVAGLLGVLAATRGGRPAHITTNETTPSTAPSPTSVAPAVHVPVPTV